MAGLPDEKVVFYSVCGVNTIIEYIRVNDQNVVVLVPEGRVHIFKYFNTSSIEIFIHLKYNHD
jgi:hypothetical protein